MRTGTCWPEDQQPDRRRPVPFEGAEWNGFADSSTDDRTSVDRLTNVGGILCRVVSTPEPIVQLINARGS